MGSTLTTIQPLDFPDTLADIDAACRFIKFLPPNDIASLNWIIAYCRHFGAWLEFTPEDIANFEAENTEGSDGTPDTMMYRAHLVGMRNRKWLDWGVDDDHFRISEEAIKAMHDYLMSAGANY